MALRMTEEEYRSMVAERMARSMRQSKQAQQSAPQPEEQPKRSKYGNRKTELDGITFDSAHEASVWHGLKLELQAGEYKGVARQVAFGLPGGVTYVADFVTLNNDGTYTVLDAKSSATRENAVYKLKKKQMKNCLGL